MSFGFGFGLPSWQTLSGGFSPASLFSAGEQGAWYDPTDVSTNWRRNLLTYSEQFDNAEWIKTRLNTTGTPAWVNVEVAPDGTTTAEKLIEDTTASNNHFVVSGNFTATAGTVLVGSVYVKAAERSWIIIQLGNVAASYAWINTADGTIGTQALSPLSVTATNVGNGWYRCTISKAAASTGTTNLTVFLSTGNNVITYTGDGTSGLFVWGAQLEQASTASLYQQIVTPEITYLQTIQPQPVLFTDSAGTTPVTAVEQFVGLMLDKSKGLVLGPELVTNGDFSSGTTGWTGGSGATLAVSSGQLVVTNPAGGTNRRAWQGFTTVAGRTYEIVGQFISSSDGVSGRIGVGTTDVATDIFQVVGSSDRYFVATSTTTYVGLAVGSTTAGATATFDNISVRELPGNHATSTGTKRPKLAARYNLLTYTEQFDNANWSKAGLRAFGSGSVANAIANPVNGAVTADLIVQDTSTGVHQVEGGVGGAFVGAGGIYLKAAGCTRVALLLDNAGGLYHAYFDITPGTAGAVTGNPNTGTPTITALGDDWFLLRILNQTLASARYFVRMCQNGTNTLSFTGDGTSGIYIWGADLRPASQATGLIGPTYQRVVDAATYDTAGFLPYLQFDGIDDSMSTGSIDFTATDKMTVWAGVRKLSDAAQALVFEQSIDATSAGYPGAFCLFAPSGAGLGNYQPYFRGAVGRAFETISTFTAPITNVLATSMSNQLPAAGDAIQSRVNGVAVSGAESSSITTAGNFGNYPLFIGSRNNASVYFTGWLTSLIVRGAQSTQSQIEATESWVNGKTGAF